VVTLEEAFQLLKKLSDAFGPSAHEDEVRQIIVEELERLCDKVLIDRWGNVYGIRNGKTDNKIMLAAHMDEIGLIIDKIEKNGFLRFRPIGGWTEQALVSQRVLVKNVKGEKILGVIGVRPPHATPPGEERKLPELKDLYIDVGARSREEIEELGIRPGCVAVLDRQLSRLGKRLVTGKALDNRAGVATMLLALKMLENEEPYMTIYAVATVQEEIGLRGAGIAAEKVNPTFAIALDTTIALDVPGVPEREHTIKLGAGPAIKFMDGGRIGMFIAHRAVRDFLIEVAESEKIPYQVEILLGGTTDATAIAFRREGIPAGGVAIPTRYVHSCIETLDLEDLVNSAKLLARCMVRAGPELIEKLRDIMVK